MKLIITLVFIFFTVGFFASSHGISVPDSFPQDSPFINLERLLKDNPEAYGNEFLALEEKFTQQKDDNQLIKLYQLHFLYLENMDSYDSMISILHQIRSRLKSKSEEHSLQTFLKLGSTFYSKRNYDSMVYWQSQAEDFIDQNSPFYADYLLLNGFKRSLEESYTEAIAYFLKSAALFENNNDQRNLAIVYNYLASHYQIIGDLPIQQEYLLKAIVINKEMGIVKGLISNYNNLGISYRFQGRLEEALTIYTTAYDQLKIINSPMLLAQNLTNRANIHEKLGDFLSAEKLFLECEQLCSDNGITYGLMLSRLNLGNLYRQMNKLTQAKERLESGLGLAIKLKATREESLAYERLAWLARDQRDFQQAYNLINKYYSLNDSLINESVKKEANELKEKYEAEKKELEIISLSKDKLQQQYLIALMGIALLALILLVNWWRNKHRIAVEKRKQEEQRYKFQLELKEKELLADSLKRVSVMNTKEAIYNDLKELIKDLPRSQASKFSPVLNELRGDQDQTILQEFETRFLGVYESFFTNLKIAAPDLTPAELKIAALMRLNFTSKETAMITNRTIGTIDNLRSNIRKKLNLEKDENLLQKLSEF